LNLEFASAGSAGGGVGAKQTVTDSITALAAFGARQVEGAGALRADVVTTVVGTGSAVFNVDCAAGASDA
jgi:xanthine dehydrogenase molybdopterin-binding subunit B